MLPFHTASCYDKCEPVLTTYFLNVLKRAHDSQSLCSCVAATCWARGCSSEQSTRGPSYHGTLCPAGKPDIYQITSNKRAAILQRRATGHFRNRWALVLQRSGSLERGKENGKANCKIISTAHLTLIFSHRHKYILSNILFPITRETLSPAIFLWIMCNMWMNWTNLYLTKPLRNYKR